MNCEVTMPADFEEVACRMSASQKSYVPLVHPSQPGWTVIVPVIPLGKTLIVQWVDGGTSGYCLAFAAKIKRTVKWYGVVSPWQDPVELRSIVAFCEPPVLQESI